MLEESLKNRNNQDEKALLDETNLELLQLTKKTSLEETDL